MLQKIELTNFRTHHQTEFNVHAPLTFVVGKNASGKTNLLEAIYLNSLTKSYRSPIRDLTSLDQDFFKVTTHYQDQHPDNVELRFQTGPKGSHRTFFINQIKKTSKDVIGLVPVVLFEPAHLTIITSGPEQRRSFVDVLLAQSDRAYLENLARYKRLLRQRNQLIKNIQLGRNKAEDLFVYNLQMVEPIYYVTNTRDKFLKAMNPRLSALYGEISETNTTVKLSYLPSVPPHKDKILPNLEQALERDLLLGHTTKGPHRDHIHIMLNKHVPAESLSRGEIRTLTLALKLAEIEYLAEKTQKSPILLLDDVLSELDISRQSRLWEATGDYQTIVTATHIEKDIQSKASKLIELG